MSSRITFSKNTPNAPTFRTRIKRLTGNNKLFTLRGPGKAQKMSTPSLEMHELTSDQRFAAFPGIHTSADRQTELTRFSHLRISF